MFFNSHSIKECNCIPWDMPRNNTHHQKTICRGDGKDCFWKKMDDAKGQLISKCLFGVIFSTKIATKIFSK